MVGGFYLTFKKTLLKPSFKKITFQQTKSLQQLFKLPRCHRPAKQIPLKQLTPQRLEKIILMLGLHSLCNYLKTKTSRHANNRLNNNAIAVINANIAHK